MSTSTAADKKVFVDYQLGISLWYGTFDYHLPRLIYIDFDLPKKIPKTYKNDTSGNAVLIYIYYLINID